MCSRVLGISDSVSVEWGLVSELAQIQIVKSVGD